VKKNERAFDFSFDHCRVVFSAGLVTAAPRHIHLNEGGLSGRGQEKTEKRSVIKLKAKARRTLAGPYKTNFMLRKTGIFLHRQHESACKIFKIQQKIAEVRKIII
jgi:hypothetical protein